MQKLTPTRKSFEDFFRSVRIDAVIHHEENPHIQMWDAYFAVVSGLRQNYDEILRTLPQLVEILKGAQKNLFLSGSGIEYTILKSALGCEKSMIYLQKNIKYLLKISQNYKDIFIKSVA